MAYTRINWANYPTTTTPVNAENLNVMDAGIYNNAQNIATNTANIATNTNNIATIQTNLMQANATAHNAVYRGLDITADYTSGALWTNIENGTFNNIYIGDYFNATINGTSFTLRIWAINYYYNKGDTAFTTPHILVVPDANFTTAYMNSTNITTGGYAGSDMYITTLPTWAGYLSTTFGSHLLTNRELFDNAVNSNGQSSSWSWYSCQLALLNEVQIYGTRAWSGNYGALGYDIGIDYPILPLALFDSRHVINRTSWWWRTVASSSTFSIVGGTGYASRYSASSVLGVRPRFLLG